MSMWTSGNVSTLVDGSECYSTFTERQMLDQNLQYALVVLYVTIMICIWITNSAVVYSIISLKLMSKNGSIELIFYLCLSDLALGFTGLPVLVTLFLTEQSCKVEMAAEVLAVGWSHTSAYIIAVIGCDRFLRMKYLNRYGEVVKRWKVRFVALLVLFLSFLHIGVQTIGIRYHFYTTVTVVGIGLDWTLFILIGIPYVLTISIVRTHRKNSSHTQMLRQVDDTVTSIAYRIMIAIATLYSPYLVLSPVRKFVPAKSEIKSKQVYLFMWFVSHGLIYANSFTNAIIFFCVNSRCRRKLLRVFFRSYNVADSVHSSEVRSFDPAPIRSGEVRIRSASALYKNEEKKRDVPKLRAFSSNSHTLIKPLEL